MENSEELFGRSGEGMPKTGDREQTTNVQNIQDLEAVINEGLRASLLEETPDQAMEVLLEYLGKGLNGWRTYIFEKNKFGGDDNTYEWVADGVEPEKDSLQNLPPEVCAGWYRQFSIGQYITIASLENIRESQPVQYEILKRQGIHSLVVVPLYDGDNVLGFYGVDNPPAKSLEYASNMLHTAAYFIVSSLKRRNLIRELENRSYNVLQALSVDYWGIYQVDFDTNECEIYRDNEAPRAGGRIFVKNGYQEAVEQFISKYVIPRDQKRIRAVTSKDYVLDLLKTKKKFSVRCQVNDTLYGRYGLKHVELHFSATEKENCVIFALRDVNAVVDKEEKNKLEARQNWEDILEGAQIGLWTIELEDDCPPRMYADRTMRRLLGVSEEIEPEECYRLWFENIEPDYVEMVQEAVKEILTNGHGEVTYPWNHPEWGKIYVRCGGVPDKTFKKQGVSLNGFHQDITETMLSRKNQERTIMELLEKVGQANAAKSEFLSHMSHDLRTPINGILGMLSIMEKSRNDPDRQRDCRRKIHVSTKHLLSLVNDILLIGKLESGMPTAVNEPFDLPDILEECITILSAQAEEREVQLVLEESELTHRKLIGNPLQLKQIMMSIIDNAIKYNRPHGFVFVRVQETACHDGMADFRFVVEDTGIGIGEEFKKHIFEPFTQEQEDARTNYNGVGLGMSIVKSLVDKMNGSVELDSQVGKGSVFRVMLSLKVDKMWKAQPKVEEQDVPGDITGMRVLLVEDNEINCEIMAFMLKDAKAEVVIAHNGKEAVDLFAASDTGTFDCVLMDLMMPVMSGYEAARVIRDMDRSDAGTVPIIALSANAFEEDIAMSKDAGMNEHLAKPVDIQKLLKAMCRHVS